MIAGRYTLEREVGRGGMGAVWLGRDDVLGRQVAMKRIGTAPGGGSPDLERAEREARLAARLNHPHVVAVYDLVVEDGEQWLVMEYVESVTLSGLVQREGALAPDQAARILCQAADALAAAHAAGIVHRDVKPSNILVAADGQVKLSDFGIARAEADASLTQTGLVTGSPAYLAPEVATGQVATDASDVWSLGATLYHALDGRPPYDVGDNVLGALYRIVHEDPPRLANAGWLGPLLAATMVRDPEARWSMAEVRDSLAAGPSRRMHPEPAVVDPARTQVLSYAVPPVPAAAPVPTTISTPVPEPAAPPRDRRRLLLPLLAVLVLLVVVGALAWAALTRDGSGTDEPRAGGAGSQARGTPGAGKPSGGGPSASTPAPAVTADGMTSFVEDYLATVTTDPATAWRELTPAFQAESTSYGQYKKFWSDIESAEVVSTRADPDTREIGYTVDYVHRDGSTSTDNVSLSLQGSDGDFRIAGES